jgi:predicted CxxxxCH...CXXCH cytochrome family protein
MTARALSALALSACALLAPSGCTDDSSSSSSSGLAPKGSAHTHHLQGGVFALGGSCPDCHAASGFVVDFSQNPSVHEGGATFDPVAQTCSNVSCHGAFTYGSISGTYARPGWNDTTPLGCASCHAMPPAGHPPIGAAPDAKSCAGCHADSVLPDGTIDVAAGTHLDGRAQTAGLGCTTCHGDAARVASLPGTDRNLPSSPPISSPGAPAHAVGAHLGHVNPTAASYLMPPLPCAECHVVPADSTHSNNPPAQRVVFGPLSRAGGASPTWDATTTGCAATYCHGNFTFGVVRGANATPLWTTTASLACTGCHGMPPTGHPTYAGTPDAASCFQCHPQSVNADGTIKQGGGHVNGKAEGGDCKSCHGDPPTTGQHTIREHVQLACDKCHPTGFTSTTVVAPFHNNGTTDIGSQAGYSCGLTGCPTGTRGTCTNSCHGRETW